MPIKAENRAKYPADWKAIRASVLERAENMCELCFVPNGSLAWRDRHGEAFPYTQSAKEAGFKAIRIVLTIAHINQDPTDNRPVNLRALCQRCHNLIDLPYRTLNAAATRASKAKP